MKIKLLVITIIVLIMTGEVRADIKRDIEEIKSKINKIEEKMVTRDEFKIYMESVDKRFNMILWVMGMGFSALGFFTLFTFGLLRKEMNKRFEAVDKRFEAVDKRFESMQEQMDKRFEEVTSILLLLVKAHEKEIGDEVINVTLGKKPMENIAAEIEQDFAERVKERRKEELKEFLKDKEILAMLKKEMERLDSVA